MTVGRFFSTVLTKVELMPTDVAVVARVPIRLGEFAVPLGMVFGWGRGADLGLEDTEGRIFVDIRDSAAAPGGIVQGVIRLVAINALGQEQEVYWEGRTETLRLGAGSMRERAIMPALEPIIPHAFSMAIVFISDVNATLGRINTTILIDARRARRTGD